jgi:hypothetical protein
VLQESKVLFYANINKVVKKTQRSNKEDMACRQMVSEIRYFSVKH